MVKPFPSGQVCLLVQFQVVCCQLQPLSSPSACRPQHASHRTRALNALDCPVTQPRGPTVIMNQLLKPHTDMHQQHAAGLLERAHVYKETPNLDEPLKKRQTLIVFSLQGAPWRASFIRRAAPCKAIPCTVPCPYNYQPCCTDCLNTPQQLRLLLHTRTAVHGPGAVLVVKLSLLTVGPPAEATLHLAMYQGQSWRPLALSQGNRHTREVEPCYSGAVAWPYSCTNSPVSVTRKQGKQL